MRVTIEHDGRVEELTADEIARVKMILMSAEEFDQDSGEDELAEEVARIAEKFSIDENS